MPQIVVPFRGKAAKQRLDAPEEVRAKLALAMLGDVLTACVATAPTVLVSEDGSARSLAKELGADVADDPGGGQGAAVASALAGLEGIVLVVNADLPCVVPHDLRTLAGAAELGAVAIAEAEDGTTNALALPDPALFAPHYGPGSSERFRAHFEAEGVTAISAAIPNLCDDVDTIADVRRLDFRAGPRTQAELGRLAAR